MAGEKVKRIALRLIAVVIGALFIYAGAVKIIEPIEFARDIDNYKMLPWKLGLGLALYLPWLEIFCGLALIFRFLYRGGLSLITVLIALFIGATVAAKMRGLDITCGCFGHASQNWSFPQHMAIDLAILIAVLALLFANRNRRVEV